MFFGTFFFPYNIASSFPPSTIPESKLLFLPDRLLAEIKQSVLIKFIKMEFLIF